MNPLRLKIVGINFDHQHMGDLLRKVQDAPNCEIVGISDEKSTQMTWASKEFSLPKELCFTDYRECLETTQPDLAILCPATARHGEWTEKVAAYDVHILVEKPFAASLAEADRMITAQQKTGKMLAINWPLAWYPSHRTCHRLINEGRIGEVLEVHYYDGNCGPLQHLADKVEVSAEEATKRKSESWFYQEAQGGGSLQDYLGYGVTLGTWFHGGKAPLEVTSTVDAPAGLEVDEHSITVARYDCGLSKFETRWGTFTNPWDHQPQPKCGFTVVGSEGTITSYDYEQSVRVQSRDCPQGEDIPVDTLAAECADPIQYVAHCLANEEEITGPLSPQLCRIGQQIIDSAVRSAAEKRTVPLLG